MVARARRPAPPQPVDKAAEIVAQINKQLGVDTIVRGSQIHYDRIPRIRSGSLALDVALGGGWTINTWHEIYGNESSGKTTLVLKTIAANQALDPNWTVFFVAAEGFDPDWARTLGCDLERMIVMNSNEMENCYGAVIEFLDSRTVDCIVIDSMPALEPSAEDEATMSDQQIGLAARINGKFFRKQNPAMRRSLTSPDRPITGFIVNQFRDKIGIMFGDPRTTPGGKAKNFYYFTRTELSRNEWIQEVEEYDQDSDKKKKDTRKVGQVISALIAKNKTAPPSRRANISFYFAANSDGIPIGEYDRVKDIITTARHFGILQTGGGGIWTYGDQKWKGMPAMAKEISYDITLQEAITEEVYSCVLKKPEIIGAVAVPAQIPEVVSPPVKTRSFRK